MASLSVQGLEIDPKDYDNPGDFIIDAVGLDPEREESSSTGSRFGPAEEVDKGTQLANLYANSAAHAAAKAKVQQNLAAVGNDTAPVSAEPPTYATSFVLQLWVLFSRRVRSITDDPFMVAYLHFQNVVIAGVVGYARMLLKRICIESHC
eukprot:SAG31_NODE_1984_length_6740_cov_4.949255_8_plen_150_part_00